MENQTPTKATQPSGTLALLRHLIAGALIGLGAVLPGVSGGVLCVIFGVYKPLMELLSHPFSAFKKHIRMLIPVVIGIALGFLGIAKLLSFLLDKYPDPSVCLFAGLIFGMLPSLYREAGLRGRTRGAFISMGAAFAVVLALLLTLGFVKVSITPNVGWNLFSGFCMGLSIIAPGMSFSTLLMPLNLYQPLVDGISRFDFAVLIPAGIGALLTLVLLARAVDTLMEKQYMCAYHAIIGIVTAATLVIVPYASFAAGVVSCIINLACLAGGVVLALLLDRFNSRFTKPE